MSTENFLTQIRICLQAILHPEAHDEGGYGFTNKKLLAQQRGVVSDIIKEVIHSIISTLS